MISAFARAGADLGNMEYVDAAMKAAEFIKRHLSDPATGELRRSWRQGALLDRGFAEDYAFLIQGLLDLYEATFSINWLQWAIQLQALMDRLFWDVEAGGTSAVRRGIPIFSCE